MPPPSSTERRALIAALAQEARSAAAGEPEPEPEVLLDYLAGRLTPEEEQRVARQLAADPAAARTLLDLAELEAAGTEAGERPADLAAVAGWREFRDRLPEAARGPRRLLPLLQALAASLLLTTMGLGTWVWRLQGALHRPIANLASVQLVSGGRAGTDPTVEVREGEPLRLVLAPAEDCPEYAAEVEGPGREDRPTVEGLTRGDGGSVTLLLPRTEPGSYVLRLVGCEPRRLLEEHRFEVVPSDGG